MSYDDFSIFWIYSALFILVQDTTTDGKSGTTVMKVNNVIKTLGNAFVSRLIEDFRPFCIITKMSFRQLNMWNLLETKAKLAIHDTMS